MKLRYIMILALKNLISHKLRTVLTVGGVALSVGFIVFLVSLGLGLQRVSTNQIANIDALKNLIVTPGKSKIITINDDTINKFETLSNVVSAQPTKSNSARFSYNGSDIDGVMYAKNIGYIALESPKYTVRGTFGSDNANEAMVSSELLNRLGIQDVYSIIGKNLKVETTLKPSDITDGTESKKLSYDLRVVAVVEDKNAPYIYMPINLLVRDGLNKYTGALVRVKDTGDVDKVKVEIESLGFLTSSVKQTVDQINQFFGVFQVVLLSFGAISILVACLGVFNTLTISLLEKTREVGFMKALGATKSDVYRLFTIESLMIGLIGSIVGITIGILIGVALNLGIGSLASATGNQPVELFYTPFYIPIFIIVFALIISYLTGLYPSFRAARINPLDALRYE